MKVKQEKNLNLDHNVNLETGEILEPQGTLGEVIRVEGYRKNGRYRYALDFSNCPTMAEQHTAQLTDINYLMEKYKPDELAAYLAARNLHRQEIVNHDFSQEPNLQEAKNAIYYSRQEFEKLPDEIKHQFKSHLEFLKFIDNPDNQEKMIRLGLMKPKQIEKIVIADTDSTLPPTQTQTTQEDKDTAKGK